MSPYQSLHSKSSRDGVNNWIEGPATFSKDTLGHAPTHSDQPRRNWYSKLLLDWWLWEIGACVISLLALSATVAVLAVYSGNAAPELPKYIEDIILLETEILGARLNAIISVLTNVVNFSVLAAVAASINQLKWLWLKDMRYLQDLQIFDNASRGPQGSLYILFHLRAMITILATVLEPFMQQLIVYPVGLVYRESGDASILRTNNVTYAAQGILSICQKGRSMDFEVVQGIMNAIYNGDSAPKLEPSCPTGNCTWPVFHSIGVCSRCVDMADKVKLEGACMPEDFLEMKKNCTISFQHGVPVVNPYDGVGAAISLGS
ncbi:hypothetical protein ACJ73_09238 [Blastomyces percursus]|uniref:Uncharacterized protein n=1 Tax=Blastomyces percursus TaxID=1658174 RepID=A0A1J9QAF8_9EURO|nr:hypothetical protein ACJ73_09238 [Blastomyces percursus]